MKAIERGSFYVYRINSGSVHCVVSTPQHVTYDFSNDKILLAHN